MFAKIFLIFLLTLGLAIKIAESPTIPNQINITTQEKNKISTSTNTVSQNLDLENTPAKKIAELKKPESIQDLVEKGKTIQTTAKTVENPPISNYTPKPVINTNWSELNNKSREAIVNIICTSKSSGSFEPLSGSGVIIDQRGIILTNAHIGQFFLLENYRSSDFLNCIARTGSPATAKYKVKLVYISPTWIKSNYTKITSQNPTGTGENDFAILKIISNTDPTVPNIPSSFPFLAPNINEANIETGNPVMLLGYPAGFLGGIAIQRDLYLVSSIVNIGTPFTFAKNTLDVFSLGGSPVAQQGSSGGAVVEQMGGLLGIIVTSTSATTTSGRDLDAISIAHINRSIMNETGYSLYDISSGNADTRLKEFESDTLPNLKELIWKEIDLKNDQ